MESDSDESAAESDQAGQRQPYSSPILTAFGALHLVTEGSGGKKKDADNDTLA